MDDALRQIIVRMTGELRAWLDQPSEATLKIDRVRAEIEGLKEQLKAGGLTASLKTLAGATREARRGKQREAAEAIAELCRPLGVVLVAREPPKQSKPRVTGKRKLETSRIEVPPVAEAKSID